MPVRPPARASGDRFSRQATGFCLIFRNERCYNVITQHLARQAYKHVERYFDWMAPFAAHDMIASSTWMQVRLGWKPTGPDLLTDLAAVDYFFSVDARSTTVARQLTASSADLQPTCLHLEASHIVVGRLRERTAGFEQIA